MIHNRNNKLSAYFLLGFSFLILAGQLTNSFDTELISITKWGEAGRGWGQKDCG